VHTCIAWIHGDEDATGGHKPDDAALEHKLGSIGLESVLDGQQLLGDHGQHLAVQKAASVSCIYMAA
jgi:hypothetical protein